MLLHTIIFYCAVAFFGLIFIGGLILLIVTMRSKNPTPQSRKNTSVSNEDNIAPETLDNQTESAPDAGMIDDVLDQLDTGNNKSKQKNKDSEPDKSIFSDFDDLL